MCINNLPFAECPDAIPPNDVEPTPKGAAADEGESADVMVPTRGARALDAAACDALLRERGGMVLGLVAGPKVGKTTMIATLYELIHRRRMAGFGFGGSETLRGYEERCHLARLASGGEVADTQRTPRRADLSFTHLRIVTRLGPRDVVFSDRSGEYFEDVVSTPSLVTEFAELVRADVVLLLIDLVQLLENRHITISDTRRLFIAMEQAGILVGKRVLLIGTKADLAASDPGNLEAAEALEEMTQDLASRSASGAKVTSIMIASRRRKGSDTVGEGLEKLLAEVLAEKPPADFSLIYAWPQSPTELDKLMRPYWGRDA